MTNAETRHRHANSPSSPTRSESSKHDDVLGREYLGASCRYLREEGELACLCLDSVLVIQPVLLRSVLRRFVHVTGCGKHLLQFCIPRWSLLFVNLFMDALPPCCKWPVMRQMAILGPPLHNGLYCMAWTMSPGWR